MKTWWKSAGLLAIGILLGLLATGGVLLVSGQPSGEAIYLSPPPTRPPLIIHISGSVSSPGVYSLPPGSRIRDAVEAAGGLLSDADVQNLNLAASLQDGDLIKISTLAPTPAPRDDSQAIPEDTESPIKPDSTESPININTAELVELDRLPGIGPDKAQKIIDYRETHGPFAQIADILEVSGIGPVTFEKIKDLITVEAPP
jgi:competence protein ComEA